VMMDDHGGLRRRARAMLESEGFDVVGEAADGESGVVAAGRLHPDVALVDIGLPGADGFDVAARLRADRSAGRIVLISGRNREDYGGRIGRSDADGVIAKAEPSGGRLPALLGTCGAARPGGPRSVS